MIMKAESVKLKIEKQEKIMKHRANFIERSIQWTYLYVVRLTRRKRQKFTVLEIK